MTNTSDAAATQGDLQVLQGIFETLRPSPALLERAIWRATCAIPEDIYVAEHLDEDADAAEIDLLQGDTFLEDGGELPVGGIVESDDDIDVEM